LAFHFGANSAIVFESRLSPVVGLPMPLTNPNGPATPQPRRPGSRRSVLSRRILGFLIAFSAAGSFGASVSFAQSQDAAKAARQERARKEKEEQKKQKSAKHVYTNEDLAHAKILTPEDRAQIEAKKNECAQKNNCAPSENSPATLDANSEKPGTSLGEVARQYRKQKEQQKELDALKPKQSEPFHLPIGTPALASPVLPERPAIRPPSAPVVRPRTQPHVMRRDPFAATIPMRPSRPEIPKTVSPKANAEIRNEDSAEVKNDEPEIGNEVPRNLLDVRPSVPPRARLSSPRKPNFPLRAPENFAVQPGQPVAPAQPRTFGLAKPVTPEHLKAAQPKAPSFGKLPTPRETIRSAQPVQPMQPKLNAPATSISKTPSVSPARPSVSSAVSTPAAAGRTVSVQRGDSLWKLAQQNLGGGRRWQELLALNPWIVNPNQIRTGAQLVLPTASSTLRSTPFGKVAAKSTVRVRRGDTLWSLAKSKLGRSSYWPCLAAANPGLSDPNRIFEGQELLLASTCSNSNRGSLRPDEQ
jgi:nucleoid-associated protein YgaU